MFTYQCKHNENRGWKKCVALFSLSFYIILFSVYRLSLLWKTALYVSNYTPYLSGICLRACVFACVCFTLAVWTSQFSAHWTQINACHHLLLIAPSSCSPSFPSSSLRQSSSELGPVCSSNQDSVTVSVIVRLLHTIHTQKHRNACRTCTLLKNGREINTSLPWLTIHRFKETGGHWFIYLQYVDTVCCHTQRHIHM